MSAARPRVVIVMGVSGVGKTTLGSALAAALGWRFEDADTYHSPANIAKMAAGVALTDDDRAEWLEILAELIARAVQDGGGLVLACSALRESYRTALGVGREGVALVHLTAPPDVLGARLTRRAEHFMPPALLDSQLLTLEPPQGALVLDATKPVPELVRSIRRHWDL
ncbi:MAG: gluconokinase [Myxococcales bacterium]|jgi:gluconokinase|nr:gluconokinase [Myxococcales bacterium]